ncbi:MAG TPA: Rieske 2Fe-2S domain-containing protein [Acidimicrobiales bacterium]|nr:Rieske 2Fe-2S domain-containing protein [Acidimicrobiales bacterium]
MSYEPVADLDDFEVGDMIRIELSQPICLVRIDDEEVRAVHDTCTHQQQQLHEGMFDDGDNSIVCPAHASRFDTATGAAIGIPAVAPIPVYACKVEHGVIYVDMEVQLNDAEIPHPPRY